MTPLREAVLSVLPDAKGIFLRCDRGESLYVTNAPMRTDEAIDWASADVHPVSRGSLVFLTPDPCWTGRLQKWLQPRIRTGRLSGAVASADFHQILEEDMALLTEGVKRLEMKSDPVEYNKMVRRRAAVCLREKRGGGTLVCCAMIADFMNEGGNTDED